MASRILLVANSSWNLFHFRKPLIEGLQKAGYEVVSLAPSDDHQSKLEALCRFVPLKSLQASGQNPIQDWLFFRELQQQFSELQPQLVLAFTIKPCVWAPLAARRLGIRCVPTMTGLGYTFLSGNWRKRLVESLLRVTWRRVDRVVFQNVDDRQLFLSDRLLSEKDTVLIPGSGVDPLQFPFVPLPENPEPVKLIFIGRMLRDKGVVELIKAFRAPFTKPVELLLVGGTDSENPAVLSLPELTDLMKGLPIRYMGPQADVRPFIQEAQAVVLPSYREGMPKSILEAMSMGRPVLVADVPGCRATVVEGENGFSFQSRSVEEVRRGIELFLNQPPAVWQQMGQRSRQMVEKQFAASIIQKAYLELIQELAI